VTPASVGASADSSERQKPVLTARQVEILGLVAEGLSSKEIGERLYISKRTVEYHLREAYDRLGASNRVQALREAWSRNLLPAATAVTVPANP
jgi:DNA-binding CsgD family transcriptional regulator